MIVCVHAGARRDVELGHPVHGRVEPAHHRVVPGDGGGEEECCQGAPVHRLQPVPRLASTSPRVLLFCRLCLFRQGRFLSKNLIFKQGCKGKLLKYVKRAYFNLAAESERKICFFILFKKYLPVFINSKTCFV